MSVEDLMSIMSMEVDNFTVKIYRLTLNSGVVCDSCRVFFRRATLIIRGKGLKGCKTGLNSCDVSRSWSCGSCRYKKCLRVGLDPEMVQDEGVKRLQAIKFAERQLALSNSNEIQTRNTFEPRDPETDLPLVELEMCFTKEEWEWMAQLKNRYEHVVKGVLSEELQVVSINM